MNVFTYWENPEGYSTPAYIDICLNSIKAKCRDAHIITPENIDMYLEDTGLHYNFKELKSIAHKADCLRVAVINRRGGAWIDADTIMLKDIDDLIKGKKDFQCMKWNDGRILNGYFLASVQAPIMKEWLTKVNLALSNPQGAVWTAFGEQILSPLVYIKYKKDVEFIDRNIFLPINIDKIPNVFFEDVAPSAFIKDNSVAVGLNHSFFCDHHMDFVKQSRQEVLDGDMLINRLLREAV